MNVARAAEEVVVSKDRPLENVVRGVGRDGAKEAVRLGITLPGERHRDPASPLVTEGAGHGGLVGPDAGEGGSPVGHVGLRDDLDSVDTGLRIRCHLPLRTREIRHADLVTDREVGAALRGGGPEVALDVVRDGTTGNSAVEGVVPPSERDVGVVQEFSTLLASSVEFFAFIICVRFMVSERDVGVVPLDGETPGHLDTA